MQFRDVLFRQQSDVSHADVLIRQESQVKLDGALNRAENLRSRGQQILNDAGNIIVELKNENKKKIDELRVASVAILDMAKAENDSTIREILELQVVAMTSLAEFHERESRNSIQQYWELAEKSAFKLSLRADMKSKAAFKLFERRLEEMSSQRKGKIGAFFRIYSTT
jgi:hypothetical protein